MLDDPCASGEQSETNTASLVSTMTTLDAETEERSENSTAFHVSTGTRMDVEAQTE